MISPFVSIAGKPQSKMITYTHCFDLKCKCKWQIPFQIQLGTESSLFVCNWPLNKVRRKSFSFISSSPTIFFAVGCYAILARTHSLTPNGKSISLGSSQAYPYPAVATPTPHFPRTSFRPPFGLFMATCENAAKVLRGQGEDACLSKLKMLPMMMSLQWNNLIQ